MCARVLLVLAALRALAVLPVLRSCRCSRSRPLALAVLGLAVLALAALALACAAWSARGLAAGASCAASGLAPLRSGPMRLGSAAASTWSSLSRGGVEVSRLGRGGGLGCGHSILRRGAGTPGAAHVLERADHLGQLGNAVRDKRAGSMEGLASQLALPRDRPASAQLALALARNDLVRQLTLPGDEPGPPPGWRPGWPCRSGCAGWQ